MPPEAGEAITPCGPTAHGRGTAAEVPAARSRRTPASPDGESAEIHAAQAPFTFTGLSLPEWEAVERKVRVPERHSNTWSLPSQISTPPLNRYALTALPLSTLTTRSAPVASVRSFTRRVPPAVSSHTT